MKTWIIDLDATLAQYERGDVQKFGIDHIGDPIPDAVDFVNELSKTGKITIFTVRASLEQNDGSIEKRDQAVASIAKWLNKHNFNWNEIYIGEGKPDGTAFIDDRAVQCRPQENPKAYQEVLDYINSVILKGK